jgi:hypothetical protein
MTMALLFLCAQPTTSSWYAQDAFSFTERCGVVVGTVELSPVRISAHVRYRFVVFPLRKFEYCRRFHVRFSSFTVQ